MKCCGGLGRENTEYEADDAGENSSELLKNGLQRVRGEQQRTVEGVNFGA